MSLISKIGQITGLGLALLTAGCVAPQQTNREIHGTIAQESSNYDNRGDFTKIMDGAADWVFGSGAIYRANANMQAEQGNIRQAVAWDAAADMAQNNYNRTTAIEAARAGRSEVNIHVNTSTQNDYDGTEAIEAAIQNAINNIKAGGSNITVSDTQSNNKTNVNRSILYIGNFVDANKDGVIDDSEKLSYSYDGIYRRNSVLPFILDLEYCNNQKYEVKIKSAEGNLIHKVNGEFNEATFANNQRGRVGGVFELSKVVETKDNGDELAPRGTHNLIIELYVGDRTAPSEKKTISVNFDKEF